MPGSLAIPVVEPNQNTSARNVVIGRMTSPKTNRISISRWLLMCSRDPALMADTGALAANVIR